jgi:predicted acylesterase/phospholipase RssA
VLDYRVPKAPETPQEGVLQTYGRTSKPQPKDLAHDFERLAKATPKVIFLGSGGVFRGAFHIGVLAAMNQLKLYPDIVVGASVGTLMGGALCRMTAGADAEASQVLSDLTDLFIHVDQQVAVTSTLKSATKQLGTRARAIQLSPAGLARRIRAGSQADAGYAATGAPPELTDALSSLLTIPHNKTIRITSSFVAGHFSAATAAFLTQVRRETLPSFNIQNCIMGVSLLESAARRLLQFSETGDELHLVQPYMQNTTSGRQVAFFGTTSFLNASTPFLLGRDFLSTGPSWSTVQEGLCSSAFPAVFAARAEADLMPGVGRSDRFFADGGMFDNLPFFPAFEVIGAVQASQPTFPLPYFQAKLLERSRNRNLIICAGLNEKPRRDPHFVGDTLFAIHDRAQKLSYESKTNTFLSSAATSNRLYDEIVNCDLNCLLQSDLDFLNGYVPAEIVDITPTDAAHINGTFAFCKTLGMNPLRIQASIADGCFQTLKQLAGGVPARANPRLTDTLVNFVDRDKGQHGKETSCHCPYFHLAGKAFSCPFSATKTDSALAVYGVCGKDPAHQQEVKSALARSGS